MDSRYKLAGLGTSLLKNHSVLNHHLQWARVELCPSSCLRRSSVTVIIFAQNAFLLIRHRRLKKKAMIYQKFKRLILGLAFVAGCSIYAGAAHAQTPARSLYDPGRIPWTALSFQAKNFWVKVSTDIHFVSLPAAEIEALLLSSPKGDPIKPRTPQLSQMTINTLIDPTFRSPVSIYNRIWFNPKDASALGRIRLRRGEDDFKKIYRFTRQGVFRHHIEPKDKKEASLAPENWTDAGDNFYAYDPARLGCSEITERSLPIYILSAADPSQMDKPISLCVFGKRQLHHVQLRKEGKQRIKADYFEKYPGKSMRIEKEVQALKIAIDAEPMESDLAETESFSFLGLQKDIAIYIDPATQLPLSASGIISGIGKVELTLHEAQLKPDKN